MAGKYKITLYTANTKQDVTGEVTRDPIMWRDVWAEATFSGGSRRTFAGRLVTEHTAVLTTHWLPGIEVCRHVRFDGKMYPIDDVVPEGFRRKVHIVIAVTESDIGYD
jgi:hypothetical protein